MFNRLVTEPKASE